MGSRPTRGTRAPTGSSCCTTGTRSTIRRTGRRERRARRSSRRRSSRSASRATTAPRRRRRAPRPRRRSAPAWSARPSSPRAPARSARTFSARAATGLCTPRATARSTRGCRSSGRRRHHGRGERCGGAGLRGRGRRLRDRLRDGRRVRDGLRRGRLRGLRRGGGSRGRDGGRGRGGAEAAGGEDDPWQECQDEAGNTYYWNSQTGESAWERPALKKMKLMMKMGMFTADAIEQSTMGADAAAAAGHEWAEYWDDNHQCSYWWNEATGESTYENPYADQAAY